MYVASLHTDKIYNKSYYCLRKNGELSFLAISPSNSRLKTNGHTPTHHSTSEQLSLMCRIWCNVCSCELAKCLGLGIRMVYEQGISHPSYWVCCGTAVVPNKVCRGKFVVVKDPDSKEDFTVTSTLPLICG